MGRRKEPKDPTAEYVSFICSLYGDRYDDREEDSRPGGANWAPGREAMHISLVAFQKELKNFGIELSTAKIRKILITGGCWTTERSREIARLYEQYQSIPKVAEALTITTAMVSTYLPYQKVAYELEDKSGNAKRVARWKEKNRRDTES